MSFFERFIHSLLFEIGAVLISAIAVLLFGHSQAGTAFGMSVAVSVTAMVWNFVFNWGFDKIFTGRRERRDWGVRMLQTGAFEGGLLFFTTPLIAWFLQIKLWQALLADLGLTLLIVLYSLAYNWAFDHLRARLLARRQGISEAH
ncbi:hypothetical protein A7P95_09395 [Eikenella longinqua]|uniref:Chlorhexidine efflux transporter domain-containing protein n=1 Tax=Eikenella longinqua TaxID=1795827 RepID=A0A1A9RVS8_9NEIS|nr:PACE efflux transporter [Eikenella longinqua]OAM26387.1 hypothetical protein A7P95_09395 [Eikenella longinqua]